MRRRASCRPPLATDPSILSALRGLRNPRWAVRSSWCSWTVLSTEPKPKTSSWCSPEPPSRRCYYTRLRQPRTSPGRGPLPYTAPCHSYTDCRREPAPEPENSNDPLADFLHVEE